MNLIYESCVKEAKSLPDFKGTDDYFVKVTFNGIIIDKKLLLIINKIILMGERKGAKWVLT
jgi:ATP-dependent DNA helicase RecG